MTSVTPDDSPGLEGLLPDPWQPRVADLRRYVRRTRDTRVADLLSLAFDAAASGDLDAAIRHAAGAWALAAPSLPAKIPVPAQRPHGEPQAAALVPRQPGQRPRHAATVIRKPLTGQARVPAPGPVLIATDGSCSADGRHCAWAFIATSGHWGCQAGDYRHDNVNGRAGALIAELRAAHLALRCVPGPVTLLCDSTIALRYLRAWRDGRTERMPAEYDLRPRHKGAPPALVALAALMSERCGEVSVAHVKGHAGHTLNEGADLLATVARRWVAAAGTVAAPKAMRTEAADIAAAFLAHWHREHPG